MDLQLLDQTLAASGEPRFRAGQSWAWAAKGVQGYEQMTNLPSALRETLTRELPFSSLSLSEEARVDEDALKPLVNGLVEQYRGDRGVYPSRDGAQHPAIRRLLELAHGLLKEPLHAPLPFRAADAEDEV